MSLTGEIGSYETAPQLRTTVKEPTEDEFRKVREQQERGDPRISVRAYYSLKLRGLQREMFLQEANHSPKKEQKKTKREYYRLVRRLCRVIDTDDKQLYKDLLKLDREGESGVAPSLRLRMLQNNEGIFDTKNSCSATTALLANSTEQADRGLALLLNEDAQHLHGFIKIAERNLQKYDTNAPEERKRYQLLLEKRDELLQQRKMLERGVMTLPGGNPYPMSNKISEINTLLSAVNSTLREMPRYWLASQLRTAQLQETGLHELQGNLLLANARPDISRGRTETMAAVEKIVCIAGLIGVLEDIVTAQMHRLYLGGGKVNNSEGTVMMKRRRFSDSLEPTLPQLATA